MFARMESEGKEDTLVSLLEEALSRKRQRRKLKQSREREVAQLRKTEAKEAAARKRRFVEVEKRFPSLRQTLREIRETDFTLPADLVPHPKDSEKEVEMEVEKKEAGWKLRRNGLEDRLRVHPSVAAASVAVAHGKGDAESGQSHRPKRSRRAPSDVTAAEGCGRKRRMVTVERDRVQKDVPAPLLKLYDTATEAIAKLDSATQVQVHLLMKRILTAVQIDLPTREFFVEFAVEGTSLGFSVGCDHGLLYIKGFLKGTEETTRLVLHHLDPTDPGFPPASFPKRHKTCYQWMQRLVENKDGTFFTASDLYGIGKVVTMEDLLNGLINSA